MTDKSPTEISEMLADDIEAVVDALHIRVARRDRRRLYCFNPWAAHTKPKLEIDVGLKKGAWNDWSQGQWGDALGLVACAVSVQGNPKERGALREAMVWARRYFGLERADFDEAAWARRREEAKARAIGAERQAARELTQARKTAQGLWLAAQPLTAGDAGWTYLAARGIDLARLPRPPRAVRLAPVSPWHDGISDEPAHVGPALCSSMTLGDGKFGSLHRTWINPERPGEKADIEPARKMWPTSAGAVIRLWRGESGLTEREAADRGLVEDVVVCEGVEDGLSIAMMTPELRVVAAGSLPGLLNWTPPKFVRRVIVAADNDWDKPQAQALLNRACKRLVEECGKLVSVARSPEGKDFNDLLRGR